MRRQRNFLGILCVLMFSTASATKDKFHNGLKLQAGIILPLAQTGQMSLADRDFPGDVYTFQRPGLGGNLQFGYRIFFHGKRSGKQTSFGIDCTWLNIGYFTSTYSYNVSRGSVFFSTFRSGGEFSVGYLYFAPEIGPSFSYALSDKLVLEGAVKLTTSVFTVGGTYDPGGGEGQEILSGTAYAIGVTPAVNLRYGKFTFGIEMHYGTGHYNYHFAGKPIPKGNSSALLVNGNTQGVYQDTKFNAGFLKVMLGFKF